MAGASGRSRNREPGESEFVSEKKEFYNKTPSHEPSVVQKRKGMRKMAKICRADTEQASHHVSGIAIESVTLKCAGFFSAFLSRPPRAVPLLSRATPTARIRSSTPSSVSTGSR